MGIVGSALYLGGIPSERVGTLHNVKSYRQDLEKRRIIPIIAP